MKAAEETKDKRKAGLAKARRVKAEIKIKGENNEE